MLPNYFHLKTNYPDADFWIIRKGSKETVGKPVKEFNKELIGVKVNPAFLVPDYAFYLFQYLHESKRFEVHAHGSLALQNIRIESVNEVLFNHFTQSKN